MNVSVASLRQSGFKVRVNHFRQYKDGDKTGYTKYMAGLIGSNVLGDVLPRGGLTTVEVTSPTGETFIGEARCSDKDSFNRKLGVKIALGRALNGDNRE